MEIIVGIFWVIHKNVYYTKQKKDITQEQKAVRMQLTGIIDSDFGHFEEWDNLCGKAYPRADFATFPRGRIVYDVKQGRNIVYADECITEEMLNTVAEKFGLETYVVCRDEHYACDKCIKKRRLFD
ncbi:MAG: hypothetical protein IJ373_00240 [Clostridia bacterium]|nr:hypothetical protein [Clostridia bacterium]